MTAPTADAPSDRPFDRPEAIGWHNDFSSRADRPRFSLAFIERTDPRGTPWGDWRVAKVADIVEVLGGSQRGTDVMRAFTEEPWLFGYGEDTRPFPVLTQCDGEPLMRFYGAALQGNHSDLEHNESVADVIAAVEDAAEQRALECPAVAGALLVVDNWRTLHYRREQSVGHGLPRRAVLMFAG